MDDVKQEHGNNTKLTALLAPGLNFPGLFLKLWPLFWGDELPSAVTADLSPRVKWAQRLREALAQLHLLDPARP